MRWCIPPSWPISPPGPNGRRTVAVLAPLELRIERTCRRDGCDVEAVRRRIAAQADDDTLCAAADFTLVNILEEELEPAVAALDRRFRYEAQHR